MFWTSLINLARRNPVKQDFFALVISSHFMAFTIIFLIFTSLPYTLIFFMFTLMFLQWAFPEKSVRLPLNPLEYQSTLPWPPTCNFSFFCIDPLEINVFSSIFGVPSWNSNDLWNFPLISSTGSASNLFHFFLCVDIIGTILFNLFTIWLAPILRT